MTRQLFIRPRHRPRTRARTRAATRPFPWLLAGLTILAVIILAAQGARAQTAYPRVGLSAAPDHYSEEITIIEGEPFTLYVCVFGPTDGAPIGNSLSSVSWVIHQVCCGSVVDIVDVAWSEQFIHEGHPILGVTSTPIECTDQDQLLIATLTTILHDPVPGGGLWAAGPYDASYDCQGELALFQGMPVSIFVDGESTPADAATWGGVKALFR